jgi:hypothetical protein
MKNKLFLFLVIIPLRLLTLPADAGELKDEGYCFGFKKRSYCE